MKAREFLMFVLACVLAFNGLQCTASALCAELSSPGSVECSRARAVRAEVPLEALRRAAVNALADLLVRTSGRTVCINDEYFEDECMPVAGGVCLKRYRRVCY